MLAVTSVTNASNHEQTATPGPKYHALEYHNTKRIHALVPALDPNHILQFHQATALHEGATIPGDAIHDTISTMLSDPNLGQLYRPAATGGFELTLQAGEMTVLIPALPQHTTDHGKTTFYHRIENGMPVLDQKPWGEMIHDITEPPTEQRAPEPTKPEPAESNTLNVSSVTVENQSVTIHHSGPGAVAYGPGAVAGGAGSIVAREIHGTVMPGTDSRKIVVNQHVESAENDLEEQQGHTGSRSVGPGGIVAHTIHGDVMTGDDPTRIEIHHGTYVENVLHGSLSESTHTDTSTASSSRSASQISVAAIRGLVIAIDPSKELRDMTVGGKRKFRNGILIARDPESGNATYQTGTTVRDVIATAAALEKSYDSGGLNGAWEDSPVRYLFSGRS